MSVSQNEIEGDFIQSELYAKCVQLKMKSQKDGKNI